MQLAYAIEAWLEAHGPSLSDSTRQDIEEIAAGVDSTGWGDIDCADVDHAVRDDVVSAATATSSLSRTAIGEFLSLVSAWADEHSDSANTTDSTETNQDSGDDETDDAALFSAPPELDGDLRLAEDGAPDSAMLDDDDDGDDTGTSPHLGDESDGDTAAASSFFGTVGSSISTDAKLSDDDSPLDEQPAPSRGSGVFSEAAEQVPAQQTGTDWITVALFAIAAVCFAAMLYFYLRR